MPGLDERVTRRVAWLMLGRVILVVWIMAAVLVLGWGSDFGSASERGLLATVVVGLGATVLSGLARHWIARTELLAALQISTDLAIVTSVVAFTGGSESVFSFLYVPVVTYAALVFGPGISLVTAAMAATFFAGAVYGAGAGWGSDSSPGGATVEALVDVLFKAGALLLVAGLASAWSRELRRADVALDERTRDLLRLRRLHECTVESLESGLLTTTPAGRISSFNREAERITGRPGTKAIGRPLAEVIPGADVLLRGAQPSGGESQPRRRIPFEREDGKVEYLGLAASTLRDPEGCASGHVLIFRDVTRLVRMENELRRSERLAAVGALAAALAHEVRNPLASISGSVQILMAGLGESGEDRERRRLMDIVVRETDRLDALIGDFLHYARPASPKPAAVALGAVLDELLEMFERVRAPEVVLERRVDGDVTAWCDPSQLRQLLWNLLLNAAQAMPGGGTLGVEARPTPQDRELDDRMYRLEEGSRWVEIVISDSGTGIDPAELDRIFDPFFTTKTDGTGLGLATVHRIVEANGGTIDVASTPGEGSRFRIHLPRGEATP